MKLRAQRAVMAFMAKTSPCCVQGLYIHPYGRYPYNLKGGVTIFNDCPYRGLWTCTGVRLLQKTPCAALTEAHSSHPGVVPHDRIR